MQLTEYINFGFSLAILGLVIWDLWFRDNPRFLVDYRLEYPPGSSLKLARNNLVYSIQNKGKYPKGLRAFLQGKVGPWRLTYELDPESNGSARILPPYEITEYGIDKTHILRFLRLSYLGPVSSIKSRGIFPTDIIFTWGSGAKGFSLHPDLLKFILSGPLTEEAYFLLHKGSYRHFWEIDWKRSSR